GAEDIVADDEEVAEVITSTDDLEAVREAIVAAGFEIKEGEITMIPQNTIDIEDAADAAKILKLIDALEDNDDVKAVYANFNIPDEIMEQLD
ncbi:MAG: YebC/PmpR family DNA-binding transcriptional regulator, partial [Firmicutes bacterium]|nr:YebC/PmpR family DNA-binding transcriptional regulator [Bacillota bacterium]